MYIHRSSIYWFIKSMSLWLRVQVADDPLGRFAPAPALASGELLWTRCEIALQR